ncbi:MAG: tetratricopeptide repeat protein [Rhodocyclaceae bacterium]|nr:tetratricopeptide repeat protein [Rhodocyclaceae bacterium]
MNFERWRHYARGWLFHFFGREDKAFTEYAEAFRRDPTNVQAARHLAFIAAQQKRFDIAEEWFVETLKLTPDDADTHFNLGYVREQAGKSRDAVAAFAAATRLKPILDRAWFGLGVAHAALDEYAEAIPAFDEAVRLQPMNSIAWHHLGMACHKAGNAERTRAVVETLVGFDPKAARQLVQDSGRQDLAKLIPELPF